jgi:hypothetical protein
MRMPEASVSGALNDRAAAENSPEEIATCSRGEQDLTSERICVSSTQVRPEKHRAPRVC